jgi:hypothetical protein
MMFNTTKFNNIYIVVVSFIGAGNRSTQRKTTDLPRVNDKRYHIQYILQSLAAMK